MRADHFCGKESSMKALVIVLDSVGCGHAPDAAVYGDAGADTLGHLFERIEGLALPNLASIGLYEVLRKHNPDFPLASPPLHPAAWHASLTEKSAGKDTTTGHWELMGATLRKPFATFEQFPQDLVREIEQRGEVRFIGNVAASGTEILSALGEEHVRTGRPILYTSADSVLQIAAHEDRSIFGVDRLQELCRLARQILDERGIPIGRVIARPFIGETSATFQRTSNRHDYSLQPPVTCLNRLQGLGVETIGIGKISDIFADSGITSSHPTISNADGMATIYRLWSATSTTPRFLFANLVDFDSLYGHRRNPEGYAKALVEFDQWLGTFLQKIGPNDLVIITADHGNDPYHRGTDHTREQVPVLALNPKQPELDADTFDKVAKLVERHLFPLNPLFFDTVFLGTEPAGGWPEDFTILTAHRPIGRDHSPEEDQQADERLHQHLLDSGLMPFRLTGASPDLSHQEPGWGFTGVDLATAAELSNRFGQEAFFRIAGGRVHLHRDASGTCWPINPGQLPEERGFFRDRLTST
jgi:phosphopentomutase